LHLRVERQKGGPAVQSKTKTYRTKAKEFARLKAVAKSLRDSRRLRKFAEMYWALALAEERPSHTNVKTGAT
jgi:hypothetical protein